MEKKRILNQVPLPPSMMRLAAVLAEIARNEAVYSPTAESICVVGEKVGQEGENQLKRPQNSDHNN